MALNFRQQRSLMHRCNIWKIDRTVTAGTGVVGAETPTLMASNVACLYQHTPNVDNPVSAGGRVKLQTILTEDVVHFEATVVVQDNWILKNVSILPDGSRSPAYGSFHRVHGAPRIIANAGARRGNKLSVMAMSIEKVPTGVS